MKRKVWLVLGLLVFLALLTLYLASPLMAFRSLSEAAENGDRGRLERMVDFPAVRAGLKDQLNDRLIGALQQDRALSEGPFGQLGALLGPTIVDQVVSAAVTPEGIAAIARTGRARLSDIRPGGALPPPPETAPPPVEGAAAPPSPPERKTRFAYQGLNRFRATTMVGDPPSAPLGWVLERRGLIGWKLVRLELPPA